MSATREQLKKIAELKTRYRKTDTDIAEMYGVTRRTVNRWVHSSVYGEVLKETKDSQLVLARDQIAGLADDVVASMYDLMKNAKSELVKFQATNALGEWLHLHESPAEGTDNDIDEVKRLLQITAAQQSVRVLPPPRPGGGIPDITEGEFTVSDPTSNEREGATSGT
jgi:hypothetical protein